jgi:hypothetical protein
MSEEINEVIEQEVVTTETVEEVKEVKLNEFSIFDGYNMFVRKYTTEIHGENAEELANQFATKINGTVK